MSHILRPSWPVFLFTCLGLLALLDVTGLISLGAGSPPSDQKEVTRTAAGTVDLCLACHEQQPDRAHGRKVLGCAVCHRGDPLAGDKVRAHRGMILNPGELRFAEKTCGQTGCHPKQVTWVKNSLMATNRGIISTLRYYWGEARDHRENITVEQLKRTGMNSPALDYYRKLCGSCHLWLEKRSLPDFLESKGGGCTACHYVKGKGEKAKCKGQKDRRTYHPFIIRSIPMENCVRCHNRSGRIGLSYQGRFESEGYGTPFEQGDFTSKQLVDGRFWRPLPEDIHHKGGLLCIDCHTQKEVMGDGTAHAHFEEQLEVTCETCHGDHGALAVMAASFEKSRGTGLRPGVPAKDGTGYPALAVKRTDKGFFLEGKADKKLHPLKEPDTTACRHASHRRLSCQACHSSWAPQCYGCHVRMDKSETQLDKVSVRETPGLWEEFRSFITYESPPLGVMKSPPTKGGGNDATLGQDPASAQVVLLVPG